MMMKRAFQIHTYILCVLLAGLYACRQEEIVPDEGQFNITLTDAPTHPTRSLPFALDEELAKSFRLHITDRNGIRYYDGTLEQYNTGGAPALRPDEYLLQAEYGENPAVALDAPYYISEQTAATVTAHTTTDVELVCRVGNSLATFAFTDPDLANTTFQAYEFVTQTGGQSVSCMADDGHNPYFKAGSTVDFYLRGTTADGIAVDYKFASISAAEKQKNYKYTLTLGQGPKGDGTLDITVDTNVETVSVNETVPQAWLPKPQLSNEGFDASARLYYRETTDAVTARINYQALMPVEDVEFELNFDDPNLYVLNKTYRLSELTEEERSALAAAGIALPELRTETGTLDFTQMTGRLLSTKDGANARNIINVRVYANHRWSEQMQYVIYAQRPEFSISVNENDFWSKEFSVRELNVTSGNADKVKENMVFQYSEDGVNWTDCNTGMKQKFAQVPSKKNYRVRALYRGSIPSNVEEVVMETPTQLPNSGLDEWTDEVYKSNYYCFYPWKTKNESCHWDTNNLFTTRHRNNGSVLWIPTIADYNGYHAVSYVPGRNSLGLAAEIRSTANGRANTSGVDAKDYNKVSGQLFTGTATLTMGTSGGGGDADGSKDVLTINKNAQHNARPTALNFFCKFQPSGNESWKVHIELMNANKEIIIENDYESNTTLNDWTQIGLPLPYTDGTEYQKCRYIFVAFYSTTNPGENMSYSRGNKHTFYIDLGASTKTYSNAYIGNILTVDDISLIYDK